MDKFRSATAKISSKGWVVIPKDMRDTLGIGPGDEVRLTFFPASLSGGAPPGVVHVSRVPENPVAATAGMLHTPEDERSWTQEMVDEHRREVEREERERDQRQKRPRTA